MEEDTYLKDVIQMMSIDLNSHKWAEFSLGDTELFDLHATLNGIDKNKLIHTTKKLHPYITRSDKNKGLDMFISKQKQQMNKGNVISIGLDTQTVFYQPYDFYTGQNIQILKTPVMNKEIAFFLIPLIKKQLETLSWGGNGATLGRLKKKRIMLPVDDHDEPDWKFMEYYIHMKTKQINNQIQLPHSNNITDKHSLLDADWGEFSLGDRKYFDILSGVRLTKKDMHEGSRPFVGATDGNNGITAWTSDVNSSLDENVLGVNYNGSVVENHYHPYEAIFSDDVKRIKLQIDHANKYHYLFLKTIILQQKEKYAYGYKFSATRMNAQKIMLPVKQGEPDWAFMEQFMRQKEQEVLQNSRTLFENL